MPCQGSVEKQGTSCIDHVCTIHHTIATCQFKKEHDQQLSEVDSPNICPALLTCSQSHQRIPLGMRCNSTLLVLIVCQWKPMTVAGRCIPPTSTCPSTSRLGQNDAGLVPSQGVFCEVEGRVARPRIWFHHVGFVQVRLFNGIVFVWKGIHSKLFGQVLVTERDHQHHK